MRRSTFPSYVLPVLAGIVLASGASAMTTLDWSTLPWSPGDRVHTYSLPADGVDLTIRVSVSPLAPPTPPVPPTFESWDGLSAFEDCDTVVSPNKDGSGDPSNRFGTNRDLGIVYDPAASRDQSVYIDLKFTEIGTGENGPLKPVATFKFEISDIDWSPGGVDCLHNLGQGFRRDQVVITATHGGAPVTGFSLSALNPGNPTFTINSAARSATAIVGRESSEMVGGVRSLDDDGTLVVDFGSTFVTDVRITYNEAGYDLNTNNNPGYRGIGILGGTTSLPVELMEFTVE